MSLLKKICGGVLTYTSRRGRVLCPACAEETIDDVKCVDPVVSCAVLWDGQTAGNCAGCGGESEAS